MKTFGRRSGGGRRKSARVAAPLPALVETLTSAETAVLVDVSHTGARLRGARLPDVGEELLLTAERVQALGTVAWSEDDERGVQFEEPISRHQLAVLRHDGTVACFSKITPEERIALRDWNTGLAR